MLTDIVREARSSAGIDTGIAQYFNNLEETVRAVYHVRPRLMLCRAVELSGVK
jgi:hypothetical protein